MAIPVDFGSLRQYYPERPNLTRELKKFMDSLPSGSTPCCVQVSHSLNMAGARISKYYPGQRRTQNPIIRINETDYYYLLAVDELETYLTVTYGAGEEVSKDDAQQRRTPQQIKEYLQGRTGILAFRNAGAGFHTELWDGRQIVQRNMGEGEDKCFTQPRVLFWDCRAPSASG
jgi:hypothetical protein